MRSSPAQNPGAAEQGFVLIEVMVSAIVLVIVSAGVVGLLSTTVHTSSEQRHGSEAYALAQEDQARLASMQLATLNRLKQERNVTLNGTTFVVHSYGLFVNSKTSTQSCGEETSSSDYAQITSVVSWPGMASSEKAKIESILSPSGSALDPSHGTLPISVTNEKGEPIAGVKLEGQQIGGTGSFSGETDGGGCAVFTDLLTMSGSAEAPNYSVAVNGEPVGVVNKDGKATETTTGAASTEALKILPLRFDHPGTIPINFKYRVGSTAVFSPSTADSVVAYNSGMSLARTIWTATGVREATVNATPLFPFTSPYTLYAGSCSGDNPNPEGKVNPPGAAAIANVLAPAGATATPATIQLPAFDPTIWTGKNEANKGSPFANADVWIRDANCTKGGEPVTRRYTTNSSGKLTDLGLPWGTYNVCADTKPGTGTSRKQPISGVTVQNLLASTTRNFYLGEGTGTQSESGACP